MSTPLEDTIREEIRSYEREIDAANSEFDSRMNSPDARIGGAMFRNAAERLRDDKIGTANINIERLENQLIKLNPKDFYDKLCKKKRSSSDVNTLRSLSKQFLLISDYEDSKEKAAECNQLAKGLEEEVKIKSRYIDLCRQMGNASTADSFHKIANGFRNISDYRDAYEKAAECEALAAKRQTTIDKNDITTRTETNRGTTTEKNAAARETAGKSAKSPSVMLGIFAYLLAIAANVVLITTMGAKIIDTNSVFSSAIFIACFVILPAIILIRIMRNRRDAPLSLIAELILSAFMFFITFSVGGTSVLYAPFWAAANLIAYFR